MAEDERGKKSEQKNYGSSPDVLMRPVVVERKIYETFFAALLPLAPLCFIMCEIVSSRVAS
jgi:hypothetical protein